MVYADVFSHVVMPFICFSCPKQQSDFTLRHPPRANARGGEPCKYVPRYVGNYFTAEKTTNKTNKNTHAQKTLAARLRFVFSSKVIVASCVEYLVPGKHVYIYIAATTKNTNCVHLEQDKKKRKTLTKKMKKSELYFCNIAW